MRPVQLFKCLADETRLTATLLIHLRDELCVGELVEATGLSQPKISRHLAQLRGCGLLQDNRKEQWVYYTLHPDLPKWARTIIADACLADTSRLQAMLTRLDSFACGPDNC